MDLDILSRQVAAVEGLADQSLKTGLGAIDYARRTHANAQAQGPEFLRTAPAELVEHLQTYAKVAALKFYAPILLTPPATIRRALKILGITP